MRAMTLSQIAVVVLGVALTTSGCGNDPCLSQCRAAQDRACTTIRDCAAYCNALDDVAAAAGCQSQRDDIERCAASVDACSIEASCGAQGERFVVCAAAYCARSPTPSACVVLSSGGR